MRLVRSVPAPHRCIWLGQLNGNRYVLATRHLNAMRSYCFTCYALCNLHVSFLFPYSSARFLECSKNLSVIQVYGEYLRHLQKSFILQRNFNLARCRFTDSPGSWSHQKPTATRNRNETPSRSSLGENSATVPGKLRSQHFPVTGAAAASHPPCYARLLSMVLPARAPPLLSATHDETCLGETRAMVCGHGPSSSSAWPRDRVGRPR